MKPVCIIERVARFVSHYSQALSLRSAFDLEHLLALELGEPRVRQIERYRETGYVIRGEPFFGQPGVRLESESPFFEFFVK